MLVDHSVQEKRFYLIYYSVPILCAIYIFLIDCRLKIQWSSSKMNSQLLDAISSNGIVKPGGLYAIRSSGIFEDGQSTSSAGQYVTVLGCAGCLDEVTAAILECWSSNFSAQALTYRKYVVGLFKVYFQYRYFLKKMYCYFQFLFNFKYYLVESYNASRYNTNVGAKRMCGRWLALPTARQYHTKEQHLLAGYLKRKELFFFVLSQTFHYFLSRAFDV